MRKNAVAIIGSASTLSTACDTVEEIVAWATRFRPEGVYAGRYNQGFHPVEALVPYRVREGHPTGVLARRGARGYDGQVTTRPADMPASAATAAEKAIRRDSGGTNDNRTTP